MKSLYTINMARNRLSGTLPNEMVHMDRNLRLNFTSNLITGTIPAMFCGDGVSSANMLYREFGCDAVLCGPGTFSADGHATLYSACRPCPPTPEGEAKTPPRSKVLGRTRCEGVEFIHGDLNGDGVLSPREILRVLYIDTIGRFWGASYQNWADMKYNKCQLTGVTCRDGKITEIDLSAATMCSNGDRKPGPIQYCKGIPSEFGLLTTLEVLQLSRQQFLRGSIPTEIGNLTNLRQLALSSCPYLSGSLPSELAQLTNLKVLTVRWTAREDDDLRYSWFPDNQHSHQWCSPQSVVQSPESRKVPSHQQSSDGYHSRSIEFVPRC